MKISPNITETTLAILHKTTKDFSIEFTALDQEGDELVFDQDGEFLCTRSIDTSWDDNPSMT